MSIKVDKRYYFDGYYTGKFTNQKVLCEKLWNADEKYHIDTGTLEDNACNPMTLRLLVAYDNLDEIVKMSGFRIVLGSEISYNPLDYSVPSGVVLMPSGGAQGVKYPISHQIPEQPLQQLEPFYVVDVHKAVYGFFSNLCSTLDRVAIEIGKLYEFPVDIQMGKNDWYYLFAKNKDHGRITEILGYCKNDSDIDWAILCRNRLIHEGILEFRTRSESIYLPEDPKKQPIVFSKQIKESCENVFWKVVAIIDRIYGDLSNEIDAHGLPLRK